MARSDPSAPVTGPSPFPPGFGWLALSTTDLEGARAFYGRLFGWEVIPAPVGALIVTGSGGLVGSLIDHRKYNTYATKERANWLPFVRVPDVEETASVLSDAGGKVWVPPYSTGASKVSVVRGATGEAFGLWQTPLDPSGVSLLVAPGVCAWFEVATPDPVAAAAFYRRVFAFRIGDEGGYSFIGNASGQFGGMVHFAGDWEDWAFMAAIGRASGEKVAVPPHWMVFFGVEDCDMFVAEAEELGAQVMTHPEPLHTLGTMAVIRDPQGVYFSVLSKR